MSEILAGIVERITFYSVETGYTVLRIKPERPYHGQVGKDGLATIVGTLPELQPGESARFVGGWANHSDYGSQFHAESVEQIAPATVEGLRRYLGSGLIKGVGPTTARHIVDFFGMETLGILDAAPERLLEVRGVGKRRSELITLGWAEQKAIKEVMLFLQTHGVTTALAVRIYKTYGDMAVKKVESNPYSLAKDIYGIGFKTADKIALHMGLPFNSPARIAAGILYALSEISEEGHVYATRAETILKASVLLDVPHDLCDPAIEALHKEAQIVIDHLPRDDGQNDIEALYLPAFYFSEKGTASRLIAMFRSPDSKLQQNLQVDWSTLFQNITTVNNIQLTTQQQEAVQQALTAKVSILTGGPGTGKTTTLRAVIQVLKTVHARFMLASPTGRAAKHLSETTDYPAQTIHRLLGIRPGTTTIHDENTPLDADILIIDEASMLDVILFYQVLKALSSDTHLLLVGDVDQLPSVGAGQVLRDLIHSGLARVTRLATIFRQSENSMIVSNAHKINSGVMPDLSNRATDFFIFATETPEETADLLVDVVKNRIPNRFGLNPISDVQVLAPMYRGNVGVGALNERLQLLLNPPGSAVERLIGGRMFRVGDKVIQLRNNYDKEVFNGDLGRIQDIDPIQHTLRLLVDDREIDYDFADVGELAHAYAITVHRSQGSEYPAVVMPILTQHYMMLQRNLLYTAITRARQLVVLVGTRKAIAIAVHNNKVMLRHSGLPARLFVQAQLSNSGSVTEISLPNSPGKNQMPLFT